MMIPERLSDTCKKIRGQRTKNQPTPSSYVYVKPTSLEIFKRAYQAAPSGPAILIAYFYSAAVTKSQTVKFTKHLAEKFGLNPSHARRTVNKLIIAGLFNRVESGTKSITITPVWKTSSLRDEG